MLSFFFFFLVKIVLLSASCRWQDWVLAEWVCQSNPGKNLFFLWSLLEMGFSLWFQGWGVNEWGAWFIIIKVREYKVQYICTCNNYIHSDSYHTFIHTYILWGFIYGYPYICVLLVAYFSVALKIRYVVSICMKWVLFKCFTVFFEVK